MSGDSTQTFKSGQQSPLQVVWCNSFRDNGLRLGPAKQPCPGQSGRRDLNRGSLWKLRSHRPTSQMVADWAPRCSRPKHSIGHAAVTSPCVARTNLHHCAQVGVSGGTSLGGSRSVRPYALSQVASVYETEGVSRNLHLLFCKVHPVMVQEAQIIDHMDQANSEPYCYFIAARGC